MRLIPAAALCSLLTACAHEGPRADKVTIQRVEVPLAVACAADPGSRPDFADTAEAIGAALSIYDLALLYAAGRQQHIAWETRLEAAVSGCKEPAR